MENKLKKENVEDILPLTPTQEGMLFHYLRNENSRQYYVTLMLTLSGEIDFEIMKEAWHAAANSNEVLRSIFRWKKLNKPIQVILKKDEIPFYEYDISEESDESKKETIQHLKEKNMQEPIDISVAPLKITLCRLSKKESVMFITNHHILYDGWSNGVILKDVLGSYKKLAAGQKISHSIKTKYKEYVNQLVYANHTEENKFWSNYLKDFTTKTSLPYSTASTREAIEKGAQIDYEMEGEVKDKLFAFLKAEGITLASFLYSAWGILLQKYSGNKDVVFGMTVSGRNQDVKQIENLVGLFINTIPLRINRMDEDTVLSLLKRTAQSAIKQKEYETASLTEIVKSSEIEGSSGLFDSIVVIENYPIEKSTLSDENSRKPGEILIKDYTLSEMTNYDLTLAVMMDTAIHFRLVYNSESFEQQIMENFMMHFKNILKQMLNNPNMKVSDIDILTAEERNKVLYEFNQTEIKFDTNKLVHTLIEEQAVKTPKAIAVVCGEEKITYEELNNRANQLAWKLRGLGAGRESIVGIMLNRSIHMIVSMLGIMKAGAAYLPLDPEYPEQRISYILENSGCKAVLTQRNVKQDLGQVETVIYMDEANLEREKTENLPIINQAEDLIYLIYSSGSTGQPKGIMLTHLSVHNFINGICRKIEFSEGKTIVSVTTISFDIFVIESLVCMAKGVRIVLAREEEQRDPKLLDKLILEQKGNMINATPSRIKMLLENGYMEGLKQLETIMIGGEGFPENLLGELNRTCTGKIFNLYGPTETTVYSTIKNLTGKSEVTIGEPIDNTQIYILDEDLNPVPIGVSGALYIGGDGLSRGYFESQEMTDKKFVKSPFDTDKKIYNTGDLARWLPDGDIYFIGRADSQVKIRGFRTELSEIELHLTKQEAVREAVVLLKEESLWAFYVSTRAYTGDELADALGKVLPYYMVPSHFIALDKMPLLPNGKTDKKILMQYQDEHVNEQIDAPENETEEILLGIWSEVLNVDKGSISTQDRFFDIGGDSLKLVRMQLKIDQVYPGCTHVSDLFSYKTIKSIAEFILRKNAAESVKLPFEYVAFPEEFFYKDNGNQEFAGLQFHMPQKWEETLQYTASGENLSYEELLTAIYAYVIQEMTQANQISIQSAIGKQGIHKLVSINLDMEKTGDFSELLSQIHSADSESENVYDINVLLQQIKRNEENRMLPLIYVQEKLDWKEEYIQHFELALAITHEDEAMLSLKYNYKRIRKEKAKEFFECYIQMIEAFVEQCSNEKEI